VVSSPQEMSLRFRGQKQRFTALLFIFSAPHLSELE
jgi:hypothetical protein